MSNAITELKRYHERKIMAIKRLGGKCVVCGTTENLEFDHINRETKSFPISENWSINLADWLKEIDKCQLLCYYCHKIKTTQEQVVTHNRWRYLHHRCRCIDCKVDYSIYRRSRYLKNKS